MSHTDNNNDNDNTVAIDTNATDAADASHSDDTEADLLHIGTSECEVAIFLIIN
jgi:hypothetical protein